MRVSSYFRQTTPIHPWVNKRDRGLRIRLWRPAAGFGLVIALAAASAGCSTSSTSSANTSVTPVAGLEKTHLNVAYLPIIQDAPLFLAIKNGYFAREGLTVSTVPEVASTAALPGMANGSIDLIAGANYESFFAMQALGKFNMKIIADSSQCDTNSLVVLAMPQSHITGPASLLGKTVAVQLKPDIQTITLNAELQADGFDPGRIRYVVFPFPQMNAALKAGKVDAVAQVEPFASQAEAQLGAKVVMSYCSPPVGDFPEAGFVSSAAWAAKYPHTALAFQRAVEQAQTLAATNRGAVEKVLPTFIPHMTAEIADIVDIGVFPTSLNAVRLQRLADLMVQSGIIPPGRLNVQSLLLN